MKKTMGALVLAAAVAAAAAMAWSSSLSAETLRVACETPDCGGVQVACETPDCSGAR